MKSIVFCSNYEDNINKEMTSIYMEELISFIEESGWIKVKEPDLIKKGCSTKNNAVWFNRKTFLLEVMENGIVTIYLQLKDGNKKCLITSNNSTLFYDKKRTRDIDEILDQIK